MRIKRVLTFIAATIAVGIAGTLVWMEFGGPHAFGWLSGSAPPSASNEAEKRVLGVLDDMATNGKTYLSVSENIGRALRLLTEVANAKNVVEIGTSTGYSGLWFCLALRKTGGHLTTMEIDPGRAAMARAHFREAGVENLVTVIEGDAHHKVAELRGPLDVVFIDADKSGYPDYLKRVLPLVRRGGLIIADNADMSDAYVEAVTSDPALETLFWGPGRRLSVTLKKR